MNTTQLSYLIYGIAASHGYKYDALPTSTQWTLVREALAGMAFAGTGKDLIFPFASLTGHYGIRPMIVMTGDPDGIFSHLQHLHSL